MTGKKLTEPQRLTLLRSKMHIFEVIQGEERGETRKIFG